MRIIRLTAENFKRLRAVEITPDNNVVVVRGKNAQGKSSVLDAIWAALGGKRAVPVKPIREGEERSEITLDLGDYIVTRIFTERDSYLTVKNADGAQLRNPQALLDGLIGAISFDPLEFARMKPIEQAKQLAEITGVDFADLNQRKQELFAQRTEVNRRVKQLQGIVAELEEQHPRIAKAKPVEPGAINDLLAEYDRVKNEHTERNRDLERLNARELDLRAVEDERERLLKRIAEIDEKLAQGWKALAVDTDALQERMKQLPDLPELQQRVQEAVKANTLNETISNYRKTNTELESEQARSTSLTKQIETLDKEKAELLSKADLPVNELAFDESGVFYHGVPFEQCSSSEQLKVSTALAISFNPKLRVIRITDGSLLDEDSLEILRTIADSEDFQIWLERVDDSAGAVGVLIEDGEIKAINREQETVAA
ncbi:AAA family ATPase [bacterium]|nr:AAA family ATPase [bacterium]